MADFVLNAVLWTLALYGAVEIIRNIYYIATNGGLKADGIYLIVAVKNQENKIEGFLRTLLFRILYGKEENINEILVTDLGSNDDTTEIVKKIEEDYNIIKVVDWKQCKDIVDNIR